MFAVSRTTIFVLVAVLLSAPLIASEKESEDAANMNAAWDAYVASLESGDKDLVIEAAATAVAAGRKVYGDGDKELSLLLFNHGKALLDDRRNEAASFVLNESLQLSENLHGKHAEELVEILVALGDSVAEPLRHPRQFKHYKRSLEIIERHHGKKSKRYADASVLVATRGYELSQTTAGMKYLRSARKIYVTLYGEDSSEVGITDSLIAKFEFSKGSYRSAVKHGLAALSNSDKCGEELRHLQLFTRALLVKAYEERNMSEEATPHCIAIGRIGDANPNQEYLPLFRMAPVYPMEQLRRGKEGDVEFEFTIDEYGFVRNAQIVSSTGKGFESAALEAVERFRYAPRFVDGAATPVDGVKTLISFRLED